MSDTHFPIQPQADAWGVPDRMTQCAGYCSYFFRSCFWHNHGRHPQLQGQNVTGQIRLLRMAKNSPVIMSADRSARRFLLKVLTSSPRGRRQCKG